MEIDEQDQIQMETESLEPLSGSKEPALPPLTKHLPILGLAQEIPSSRTFPFSPFFPEDEEKEKETYGLPFPLMSKKRQTPAAKATSILEKAKEISVRLGRFFGPLETLIQETLAEILEQRTEKIRGAVQKIFREQVPFIQTFSLLDSVFLWNETSLMEDFVKAISDEVWSFIHSFLSSSFKKWP